MGRDLRLLVSVRGQYFVCCIEAGLLRTLTTMFEYNKAQLANFVAGGTREPLLPMANPLLQQAAALGEVALATVARFRPLSRAVFSYLQASGMLADAVVAEAIKTAAKASDIVTALRCLSPAKVLEAAYGGQVPVGLMGIMQHVSATQGLTAQDALRLQRWMTPACDVDVQRGKLVLEAVATWKQHKEPGQVFDLALLIGNIFDLPDTMLGFLNLRDIETLREVALSRGGAEAFARTINHVARVCSTFEEQKEALFRKMKPGAGIGPTLRQLLENHADDLPKPRFPHNAQLEVLRPVQALKLSTDWRNCIRKVWMDSMLAGDVAFVRSTAYELVARLQQVRGPHCSPMWMLEEIAAPNNNMPDEVQKSLFTLELLRGDVVVAPEHEFIGGFLHSVIGVRHNF